MNIIPKLVVGLLILSNSSPSIAAESLVVAFGASQTYGKGVTRDEAYPAQLELLLHQKGYDVRVINSGANGHTTGAMLQRLEASVPSGTTVVIFQPAMTNAKVLARNGRRIQRQSGKSWRRGGSP